MATHSSVLAWRIPGMAEPGGLPSRRSHRVGHDWSDLAAAAAAIILLYQPEGGIGNSEVSVLYYLSLCHLPLFFFFVFPITFEVSLVAQMVKHLPAMWRTRVPALGQEDPLEKKMATHSSILAWKIPWTKEPGGLHSPWVCKESDMTEWLHSHLFIWPVFVECLLCISSCGNNYL